ncbi:MAG TPA: acyl-CoA dehydrogenase family protein [Acidimicrobiales bacterium]|nr:acyl-CoA dehydrogenase family protein [Acidimicrobiales bacterium]
MDFELSEDQLALRAAAAELLDDEASPARIRAHLASGAAFDAELWASMVEQGWLGVSLPEDRGGLGLGWVEAVVLLEELGRRTAPVPFLPTLVALQALVDAGPTGDPWVDRLVSGDAVGGVAWTSNPDDLKVGSSGGDVVELTGRPGLVEAASVADVAVVGSPSGVYLVDLRAVGRPVAEPAMDVTRSLSWLELDRTEAVVLGGEEASADLLDRGAVGTAALLLGGADRVLAMATQYAKDRVQFGQPIGSFQAVKHRCADMVVDVEGMRSSAWYAAWALASHAPDRSLAASTAKVWCSEAAKRVMASGLQVHGGIGFTWDHDLHLYMKRSQFEQTAYGNAAFHRDRLADLLRGRMSAGLELI